MSAYIALLRKEPDSDYGVEFPDFPGCVTFGKTLEEARRMAAEALALHIEGMTADGEGLPEPSLLQAIMDDPTNRDAIGFLVDAPTPHVKAVRIQVSMPGDVVEQIDRVSRNRSRFLTEAALEKLRRAA